MVALLIGSGFFSARQFECDDVLCETATRIPLMPVESRSQALFGNLAIVRSDCRKRARPPRGTAAKIPRLCGRKTQTPTIRRMESMNYRTGQELGRRGQLIDELSAA